MYSLVLFCLVVAVNMLRNFLQIVDNFKPVKKRHSRILSMAVFTTFANPATDLK